MRRKIASAGELRSVVRTMKALAASNIAQYEKSVASLADYVRAVEWGLGACLRQSTPSAAASQRATVRPVNAVIFGSDQGMVGPFNELITDHALSTLAPIRTEVRAWAVGERVQAALLDAGVVIAGSFPVPGSVKGITSL
ncbi:MAG TPA: F0F1 ATP synthase subunit gamma, partial [Steroidobacteraceae bacterium]|nr:F0F1 ATP synthase subunit gamma [Steroidobacteraceae bacterium]